MTAQQLAYAALGVFVFFIFALPLAEKLFKKFRGGVTVNDKEEDLRMDCPYADGDVYCDYDCDDGDDCPFNQKEELPKRVKE